MGKLTFIPLLSSNKKKVFTHRKKLKLRRRIIKSVDSLTKYVKHSCKVALKRH